jgi:hypothetical protein
MGKPPDIAVREFHGIDSDGGTTCLATDICFQRAVWTFPVRYECP